MNTNKKIGLGGLVLLGLGTVVAFLGLQIVACALCFLGGWIAGWIAKLIVGNLICSGFALVGLVITPDKLPLLGGLLGWVGAFFRSNSSVTSKKD